MNDKEWENLGKNISPRLDILQENEQYLESVGFMSNILESEVKHVISEYENYISGLLEKSDSPIIFFTKSFININKMTLGQLNDLLKVYCKNNIVIEGVAEFNRLRIKTIHKVLTEDIEKLEKEIAYYRPKFYKLLEILCDERVKVHKKQIK